MAEDAKPGDARPSPSPATTALLALALGYLLLHLVWVPLQRWNLELGLLLSQWVGLGALAALAATIDRQRVARALALARPPGRALVGAALVGLSAGVWLAFVVERLAPPGSETIKGLREAIAPSDGRPLPLTLVLMSLSPALCEEAFFRGTVLRGLLARLRPAAAIAVTSLAFAAFHLDAARFLPTALLGVLFGWIAFASGSTLPSMLAHGINNALIVLMTTVVARLNLPTASDEPMPLVVALPAFLVTLAGLALVGRPRRVTAPTAKL